MLKFDKIIHRLTLEEKVELLVSSVRYENSKIEDFNLPRFKINEASNANLSALAATWDLDLIHDIAKETANLDNNHDSITINACSVENKIEYNANTFSQDKYANGRFAAAYLRGINDSGKTSALLGLDGVNPDNEELRREELLASEVAIKEGRPSVVIASSANNLDILRDEYDYKGVIMMDSQDVAKAFYNGCHFVFSTENPKEALLEAINEYRESRIKLQNEEMSIVEFDQMERDGLVFNPEKLDVILNSYLGLLYDLDDRSNEVHNGKVNTELLDKLTANSIIMLKNDGVLPILENDEVLIAGAAAFNNGVNAPSFLCKEAKLNIVGAAHAYSFDLNDDTELMNEALNMAKSSKYVLLYLVLKDKKIDDKQINALRAFVDNNKKVISIVEGYGEILSDELFNLSSAVIQINLNNAYAHKTIFNLVKAEFNPVGRTAWINGLDGVNYDLYDSTTYRYPMGYGLNFTNFEYSRMVVDKHGVALTVKNTGAFEGEELVTLFVEYENPDHPSKKCLRAFKKVSLKSNESARVFLDFDEFTFKSYSASNKCDEIKTGSYYLYVYSGFAKEMFKSQIDIAGKLLNPHTFSNELADTNDSIDEILNKFRDTTDRREFFNERKGLKFKTKMIILSLVFVYFNAMFIYIGVGALPSYTTSIAIFATVVALFNIACIVIGVLIAKNKNKYLPTNVRPVKENELDNLVGAMENYNQIGKITYPKPVVMMDDEIDTTEDTSNTSEEKETEEGKQEKEEETNINKEYLDSNYDCSEGGITFAEDIYPAEYVQAYNDYSSNNGVIIEPKSSRALFSGLGCTHLLILNSGTRNLLDKEIELILSYLGNQRNIFDLAGKESLSELLWEQVDIDTYKRTPLSGLLANIRKLKKTCNIIVFKNPDMTRLRETLGVLIDFIINPNGDHYINLGTEDNEELVLLPKNLIIILEPNSNSYLDNFDPVLAERSLSLELQLRVNDLEPIETPDIKYMSYQVFERIAIECKERNIIPEEYWKKLDDLEEEINNLEPFRLENKTILDFERFVGLMIEAGGDIDESIDMALAYRIVPILKSYNVYKNKDGDNTLYAIIERIFTAENTELTKRAIKKALD